MVNRIELPQMPQGDAEKQMKAMYSYLYQMAQALNNNLAEIGGAELTDSERIIMREVLAADAEEQQTGVAAEAETLKSLIIKTASFIKVAIDQYDLKLMGSTLASGKMGRVVRNTQLDVDVTPEGIQQSYTFQEIIQGLKRYEINAKNYIKSGLLRTKDGLPVYGVAIGKDIVTFAEDGTETYNDGNKVAELTAEELSFWQNGAKVAGYKGSGINFAQNVTIASGKKLIIDTENFKITSAGKVTVKGDGEFSGELKAASGTFAGTMSASGITSGTMSANRISGGTLTLGGNNNANGTLIINDASGEQIGKWDKDGISAKKGTFSGNLSAAGGTFTGNLQAAGGTFAGTMSAAGITSGTMSADRISGGTIDATDVSIINLDASNITSGTISADKISGGTIDATNVTIKNLDASKITSGTMSANKISGGTIDATNVTIKNLDASKITSGTMSANKISGGTIDATDVSIINLNASNITSGTMSASKISGGSIDASNVTITNLSASNITGGTMSANRISGGTIDATDVSIINLNASNITSGTMSANKISGGSIDASNVTITNLSASNITGGTMSANRISGGTIDAADVTITNLDASNITSGTMSASIINGGSIDASNVTITNLSASNITGGTMSANRISGGTIDAADVTITNLDASNITTGAMSANRITSGTMSANRISGGTLTLGGDNNANGTLIINDASGAQIGKWDKDGLSATKGSFSGTLNSAGGTFSGSLECTGQKIAVLTTNLEISSTGYLKTTSQNNGTFFEAQLGGISTSVVPYNSNTKATIQQSTNTTNGVDYPEVLFTFVNRNTSARYRHDTSLRLGTTNRYMYDGTYSVGPYMRLSGNTIDQVSDTNSPSLLLDGTSVDAIFTKLRATDARITNLNYTNMAQQSSRDVKHDIRDMPSMGERLDALHPITFVYDDDEEERKRYGLIYEDTVEVLPEICTGREGNKGINYVELIPMLLKEIQELRGRVNELERRLENVQGD